MIEKNLNIDNDIIDFIQASIEAGIVRGIESGVKRIEDGIVSRNKKITDNRLYNTKLLLSNYRRFVNYVDNAVFTDKDIDEMNYNDIIDKVDDELYYNGKNEPVVVSILSSKKRTEIIIKHIKRMINFYLLEADLKCDDKQKCIAEEINTYYIKGDKRPTLEEMSDIFFKCENQIRRDLKKGINEISILMFGFDGIKKDF